MMLPKVSPGWRGGPTVLRALLGVLLFGVGSARAATFVVDSTGDAGANGSTADGICDSQAGPSVVCTLRAAIEEANGTAGADVIQFAVGSGLITIAPGSALPTITSQVTIDGTSQPGFAGDPIVELNITSAGPHGLSLGGGSSNSVIRGLIVNRASGVAIRVFSSNNVVARNFLGTNAAGLAASANGVGVYMQTGTNNVIGGTVAADRNVISGNSIDGIQIDGASGNFVRGNYIGLDKNGTGGVGNATQGVAIFGGATNNTIGGTVGGARNVIAANGNDGVLIAASSTGNRVEGNFIGTNAAGAGAGIGNKRGVEFDAAAFGNFVGGSAAGASNLIAFNINGGVETTGAAGTGNLISTNNIHSNGTRGIDLGENGVTINDVGDGDTGPNSYQNYPVLSAAMTNGAGMANFAGSLNSAAGTLYRVEFFANAVADGTGFGEGERYLGFANVTTDGSGNATIGVTLAASLAAGELVTATATDPSNNTSEFSRAIVGVASLVVTTTADTVDGTTTTVANLIAAPGADGRISLREALTATNATGGTDTIRFGIPVTDANHRYYRNDAIASSLTNEQPTTLEDSQIGDFDPDYVGTPFSWFRIQPGSVLPTVSDPVVIDAYTQPGASANTVAAPATSNAILKIVLNGSLLGAGNDGLTISAGSSTVRGLVIQQVPDVGILLTTSGANVVEGSYLGTDPTGTLPLGNDYGVRIGSGSGNTVGGTTPAARNLLAASQTQDGVFITGAGTNNNLIQGNFIGIDVRGTSALGNANRGVQIASGASFNVIGGTTAAERNIISGNGSDGVIVADAALAGTTGNVIQGNYIGTDVTGTLPLANAQHGVSLGPVSNTTIGGSAAGSGNLIAYSTLRGIRTAPTTLSGNSFLGNSIHSNGSLGIDLSADGVTANDALDADSGPNDLLNWPLLTGAIESGGNLTVYCHLDVPAGWYRLEYFKNPSGVDPSGNGEGEVFASSKNVNHPGGGTAVISHTFPGAVGDVITATATVCTDGATCSLFGSSSEFSNSITAVTTAVKLTSFTAVGRDGAVDLAWKTGAELNNLGFHLYRSRSAAGPFERITDVPIPGLGSSPTGAAYAHSDESLSNGVTYYYELEDIETRGRTTLHGPIAATPREATSDSSDDDEPEGDSGSTYGVPSDVSLRILERGPNGALVELTTGGFFATPLEDGTVRLEVPGFESVGAEGSLSVPVRRTWLEAVTGRSVRILSVREIETTSWPGLRPADTVAPEVIAVEDTVRAGARRARRSSRDVALFPATAARVVETGFQGDVKKALVELAPLRWDARTGRLLWTRRLLVRVSFSGQAASERGERARRRRDVGSHRDQEVLARLATTGPGLYRVEFGDIFPRGGGPLSSGSLRLSRLGAPVAYHLEPSPDRFGPGSSLYFLSEGGAANPYGSEAVYELELGGAGTVMAVRSEASSGPALSEALERKEWEQNRYYQAGLLEAPSPWLWDVVLSTESKSYPFRIDGLSTSSGEDAKLEVYVQGGSDFDAAPDHHVRFLVNGVFAGEESWDGKTARTMVVSLGPGILREGENELSVENVGDTGAAYSMVFVDRFALTFPRRPVADSGWFRGTFRDSGNAVVEGLGRGSLVLETSSEPVWLEGATPTSAGMSFHVQAGESYLAVSPEALLEAKVRKSTSSDLRSTRQQADYLLVGPKEFLFVAEPLLKRRREQGLAAKAVAIEDVYDEFGHGEARPEALKEFLTYAYHEWRAPSPRVVVLFGDATYDGKNFLGTGVTNRVPTLMKKTSYLWTASDPSYAAVNGEDGLPDLALGRLPAESVDEARVLVAKLLAYEDSARDLSGPAVFVADDPDAAGDFESDSDEIAGLLASREITKIYLGDLGAAETRYRIVSAFDRGASFVSYVGHGGIGLWASENVFGNPDVRTLGPQEQQPIVLTMNCLNGYFHFPYFDSLAEALVKAEGKGAIAAFAPSGLSLDAPAHLYHRFLMEELTSSRNARLGDAVLQAQIRYAESGAFPELLTIYHLFGDPALPLR